MRGLERPEFERAAVETPRFETDTVRSRRCQHQQESTDIAERATVPCTREHGNDSAIIDYKPIRILY